MTLWTVLIVELIVGHTVIQAYFEKNQLLNDFFSCLVTNFPKNDIRGKKERFLVLAHVTLEMSRLYNMYAWVTVSAVTHISCFLQIVVIWAQGASQRGLTRMQHDFFALTDIPSQLSSCSQLQNKSCNMCNDGEMINTSSA